MTSATVSPEIASATWALDASHSSVGFAVKHLMIATVRGHFNDVTATVTIENGDYASARISAEIESASINTRNQQRDDHLRSADFFDAAGFPKLTFQSTQVNVLSADELAVTGDLTIRGTTKAVTLSVSIDGSGMDPWGNARTAFTAETKIRRSEYGLTWNQALEAGGVAVSDEIRITIEGQLVRQ